MADAGERIKTEHASILISPEGTRSPAGKLGAFKMGAFYLADSIEVPLVVMLFRWPAQCQPLGTQLVRPGTITVEILDTIEPAEIASLTPRQLQERGRSVYLRVMEDGTNAP